MTNSEIRKRAWEIFKNAPVPLLLVAGVVAVINLISDEVDFLLLIILAGIVELIVNIGSHYMTVRGWTEGKADINHMFLMFRSPVYSGKILPLVLAETGVTLIAAVPAVITFVLIFTSRTGFLNFAFLLLTLLLLLVVAAALSLSWYILVMEPELKTTEIMKKSVSYMGRHWAGILVFSIATLFIPVIIIAFLTEIIDSSLVTLLSVPFDAFFAMARTGYIYENVLIVERDREALPAATEQPPV